MSFLTLTCITLLAYWALVSCTKGITAIRPITSNPYVQQCFQPSGKTKEVGVRSKLECAAACSTSQCSGYFYNRDTRVCRLSLEGIITYCSAPLPTNIEGYVVDGEFVVFLVEKYNIDKYNAFSVY
jgi:hypothetical protein